jgi:hypothetical protein
MTHSVAGYGARLTALRSQMVEIADRGFLFAWISKLAMALLSSVVGAQTLQRVRSHV